MAEMFSTKGRYALRAMADLAMHDGWVSLGDVAERQHISRKYLEQVIALMHKAGYVESQRGKGGGYRLTRRPEDYTLGQILRAAEGNLAPVACLDCTNDEICPIIDTCPTIAVWRDLGRVTSRYLDSKTLADIARETTPTGELAGITDWHPKTSHPLRPQRGERGGTGGTGGTGAGADAGAAAAPAPAPTADPQD